LHSNRLADEWIALAPAWIREAREGRNPTRNGLLDRPVLGCCGDVAGLRVLDCGCGEGRFCRILAERGAAHVMGIDLCEEMILAAKEIEAAGVEYGVADAQDLGFLEDGSFDLAVSYLNQCDLPDFGANTREVFRVLRPGGRFVVANVHPMRSAVGGWQRAEDGTKQHVILDRYLEEGERRWTIMGSTLTNFHRALSTCVTEYLRAGFRIAGIAEPSVDEATLAGFPELDDELRVPNFILFSLDKP